MPKKPDGSAGGNRNRTVAIADELRSKVSDLQARAEQVHDRADQLHKRAEQMHQDAREARRVAQQINQEQRIQPSRPTTQARSKNKRAI
jgi:uncharacterized protein (DUF3084 family)